MSNVYMAWWIASLCGLRGPPLIPCHRVRNQIWRNLVRAGYILPGAGDPGMKRRFSQNIIWGMYHSSSLKGKEQYKVFHSTLLEGEESWCPSCVCRFPVHEFYSEPLPPFQPLRTKIFKMNVIFHIFDLYLVLSQYFYFTAFPK